MASLAWEIQDGWPDEPLNSAALSASEARRRAVAANAGGLLQAVQPCLQARDDRVLAKKKKKRKVH